MRTNEGKVTLIVILILALFLGILVFQDRNKEFLKSAIPPCGDPNIKIKLPKYLFQDGTVTIDDQSPYVTYKLLVTGLPIKKAGMFVSTLTGIGEEEPAHSQRWDRAISFPGGREFRVYYPSNLGNGGEVPVNPPVVSKYKRNGGIEDHLFFVDWGLAFLVHIDPNTGREQIKEDESPGDEEHWITDVYQDISYDSIPINSFNDLFKCNITVDEGGTVSLPDRKQLQIGDLKGKLVVEDWNQVVCKPVIYLYPPKKTLVNVKVRSSGKITYTDPLYPASGWEALAYPGGKIIVEGKEYSYLYYESILPDSEIVKPDKGFVVPSSNLPALFHQILPGLGLTTKETQEFSGYWQKALPYSPYYFVGIIEQDSINRSEPLTVSPAPDSTIRVRLYFEALNERVDVEAPIIVTPKREGFSLVEWGGLFKAEKDRPFTCLM